MMESARWMLPPLQTSQGISLISVVTAQKTVVSNDLYRLSAIYSPILCTQKFGYMGKTSLSLIMELSDRESKSSPTSQIPGKVQRSISTI
ncbi:hypothetical protein LSH36_391g02113 [Paralvinella palmiformis]|uniref:Uncharacterized protein n=1 Tax=Paralvinella palmiformis TaxID=53620 RepID=A0AAD9JCR5_9ANNE|nr:hypothetical protein LSH36_391g02113 [Paralvinella palmiformis]